MEKRTSLSPILKRSLKIAASLFGVLLLFFLVFVRPNPFYNPAVVPQLVTANFIDLDRVFTISKFRSGAGHDYSTDGETCRSMKHYLNVSHNYNEQHQPVRSEPTAEQGNITLYAPFDGLIWTSHTEYIGAQPIGTQVTILARHNPLYDVRFFHIDLLPGLHFGSRVQAGQAIGTIGPKDGMDIAFESNSTAPGGHNMSVFNAMTDAAFAPYAAMGYQRQDFIISKEYRDAHPLTCADEGQFTYAPTSRDSLNEDYIHLRPDIYEPQDRGPGATPIHYGPPIR